MLGTGMMLGGRATYDITLASNRAQWQRSVDAPQIPSTTPVLLILRINNVIEIQSNSTSIGAIHLDALANGSEVQIINLGYLLGDGGNGGDGGAGWGAGLAGGAGGPAIRADFTGLLKITNSGARIWGGGGGGGGGGGCALWNVVDLAYDPDVGGSGGGGGAGGGAAGAAGVGPNGNGAAGTAGTTGSVGTNGTGGNAAHAQSGDGAIGGTYGVAGSTGSDGSKHGGGPGGTAGSGAAGGAAGYAVKHNAGTTVQFVSGSGSPSVLGSVGT